MTTVSALFAKVLAYVLLLEQEAVQGGAPRSYERVRHELLALLVEHDAEAEQDMPAQVYKVARYAVTSWVDTVLSQPATWEHAQRWQAAPLQAEVCESSHEETVLRERLHHDLTTQPEVREIYALCESLRDASQDADTLADVLYRTEVRSQRADTIPLLVESGAPRLARSTRARHRGWRTRVGLVCCGVVAIGLGVWFWPRPGSTPPPPSPTLPLPTPVAVVAPACPPGVTLPPATQQFLAELPCTKVTWTVQECAVTLTGRIASEVQRTDIYRHVQQIPEIVRVNDALHLIPPPFCEVLGLFEPLRAATEKHALTLTVRPNKAGALPVYVQGDDLLLEVTTPSQFPSYVYVDLYDSDGRVHYLFVNPDFTKPFAPGSTRQLGYVDGRPVWGIGPPYGHALVTILASNRPLVFPPSEPQYDPTSVQTYLARLRQALSSEGTEAGLAATFVFLETRAQ